MRVLIIDDHPLYRNALTALLCGLDAAVQTVGMASVAEVEQAAPDIGLIDLVLLDMNLPGISRLDALAKVKQLFEHVTVVVVSGDEDPGLILQTIDAGAAGYILKTTDPMLAIQALRLVLAQGVYLPDSVLRHRARGEPAISALPALSDKQRSVLRLLLQGKANKVIARELSIAEGTVKAHLWAVYQSLGVRSRSQAMCRALELGLLSAPHQAARPPSGPW